MTGLLAPLAGENYAFPQQDWRDPRIGILPFPPSFSFT